MSEQVLSVIVPVYNAKKYLARCIDSILAQSYQNFELILVDDGSTDGSLDLCHEYARRDARIQVLHIDNSGPFQARKKGISCAVGKYVTFLDADDWIERKAFEDAAELLGLHMNVDLLTYEYVSEYGIEENLYPEGIYTKDKIISQILDGMMFEHRIGKCRLNPSLCTKYIRRSIVYQIVEDIEETITLGEDALVSYTAVCMADQIAILHKAFYHYMQNEKSCTHSISMNSIEYIANFQQVMKRKMKELEYLKYLEDQIVNYTRVLLSIFVKSCLGIELSSMPYRFPAEVLVENEKVIVYGSGSVGKSYVKSILLDHLYVLNGWFDKRYRSMPNYMGIEVRDPCDIAQCEFDKIIIAVYEKALAESIKVELMNMFHISEEKIYWTKPVMIG